MLLLNDYPAVRVPDHSAPTPAPVVVMTATGMGRAEKGA